MVSVFKGVQGKRGEYAGMEVAEVRNLLTQGLNLAPGDLARVNDEPVAGDFVLEDGDEVEFVKPAGEKAN